MNQIPIIKIDNFLVAPIQIELTDEIMREFQKKLVDKIKQTEPRGILIDLSEVSMIDSYMARIIGDLANLSKLFDAKTVVTGIQPEVAITLIELGISFKNVQTALSVDQGMEILRSEMK